jgi:hypothetical protein
MSPLAWPASVLAAAAAGLLGPASGERMEFVLSVK